MVQVITLVGLSPLRTASTSGHKAFVVALDLPEFGPFPLPGSSSPRSTALDPSLWALALISPFPGSGLPSQLQAAPIPLPGLGFGPPDCNLPRFALPRLWALALLSSAPRCDLSLVWATGSLCPVPLPLAGLNNMPLWHSMFSSSPHIATSSPLV